MTLAFKYLLPFLLILPVASGCFDRNTPGENKEALRPVRYVRAEETRPDNYKTFPGIIKAGISVKASFKVAGTIEQMGVKVGDRLDRGDTIAVLEATDYDLQVQQAQAALSQAEAQARNADANYRRVKALYENRNASLNELDAARAAAESSRSAVESVQKQLALARRQLDYTTLSAPADCRVASVLAEANENVAAGNPVAVVNYLSLLEVQVAVPGQVISRIKRDDPVEVSISSIGRTGIPGVITEVGISTTMLQTTFPVTVRLQEEADGICPGMAADVRFLLNSGEDSPPAIFVPPVAVGEDMKNRFIYVVEPLEEGRGRIGYRPVTIGRIMPEGIEISKGVNPGDLVVTAGMSRITEGMIVKLESGKERF